MTNSKMTVSNRTLVLMKLAVAGCLVAAVAASASERPKHQPGLTPETAASASASTQSSDSKRDTPHAREFNNALLPHISTATDDGAAKPPHDNRGKGQRGTRLKMDSETSSSN